MPGSLPGEIRPFQPSDADAVKDLIAGDQRECRSLANQAVLFTPIGAGCWLVLAGAFALALAHTELRGTWHALLGVSCAAATLVIIILADCHHATVFGQALTRRLAQEDVRDIILYYGAAPASAFYVLDQHGQIIGCIGIDASRPNDKLPHTEPAQDTELKSGGQRNLRRRKSDRSMNANSENVALVRVLCVRKTHRSSGAEQKLFEFALAKSFAGSSPVQWVEIALRPHVQIHKIKLAEKLGLSHHEGRTPVDADLVEVADDIKSGFVLPAKLLARIWPLDFRSEMWSIDRIAYTKREH